MSWFTDSGAAHVGPHHTSWIEVTLWHEFKQMFQDKDNWRYVLRRGHKYLFYQRAGMRVTPNSLIKWELSLADATLYRTYGEASHVMEQMKKPGDKKINIIILRPISRIFE